MDLNEANRRLDRLDERIGHRPWAPLGYLAALAWYSVVALARRGR